MKDRQQALDQTIELAKDFFIKEGPFTEWLDKTEKKAFALEASLEGIGADVEKMEASQQQQRAVSDDVMNHKPDLDDLLISGQALEKHCSPEEATTLQVIESHTICNINVQCKVNS